jgi:hypothetical protein
LAGSNASVIASRFAVRLRFDLMPEQKPMPKDRALKEEKRLAKALRQQGFGVWQY